MSKEIIRKPMLHFLHIGKTGGSAFKSAIKKHTDASRFEVRLHGHATTLKDIPVGEYVTFFLRDPISRFISGFYSRQRKGQPRFYSEWRPREKEVFEHFQTPNQLALSLAIESSADHSLSHTAMKKVQHLKRYRYWYGSFEYFRSRIKDIFYIGFQESLSQDFGELKRLLGLPDHIQLPDDDIGAHRNPKGLDKSIDDIGVTALKHWYSEDYRFISICKEIKNKKLYPGAIS